MSAENIKKNGYYDRIPTEKTQVDKMWLCS